VSNDWINSSAIVNVTVLNALPWIRWTDFGSGSCTTGDTLVFNVEAGDANGQVLGYHWFLHLGSIIEGETQDWCTWRAPDEPDICDGSVTVSDGIDERIMEFSIEIAE